LFPLLLVGLVGCKPADPPPLPAKPSDWADALDLLLLVGDKPARLELTVEIDGKPVPQVWDGTFARLHAFCDRDGDGSLSKAEAARLPTPFALRQVLWGQLVPATGAAPAFDQFDLDADGKLSKAELADFYRRAGLGGVLVGVGKPPATDKLTDALLQAIDENKDGTATEAEWKKATEVLRKLDANDDELVGPGELVEKTAYPGANGAVLLTAPVPNGKTDGICDALPLVLLPLRAADDHWVKAVTDRRGKERRKPADLMTFRSEKPAVAWAVKLDGKPTPPLVHSTEGVRFEIRTDAGKLAERIADARKRYESQFAEFDANSDGTLDARESASPKASQFQQLLTVADRDDSQTLSKAELNGWLGLQGQIASGCVLLTLLDHGRGLFEVLDADHDGGLGVRELRAAWDRLTAVGCVTDGKFDRSKLPRHLLACVSQGHPESPLAKPARPGPAWFAAMDRNGDGDVSKREFTAGADVFATLDADGDGLLSAAEAERARK
jgi:Ca2+-binding EF-hand superfamily protein